MNEDVYAMNLQCRKEKILNLQSFKISKIQRRNLWKQKNESKPEPTGVCIMIKMKIPLEKNKGVNNQT